MPERLTDARIDELFDTYLHAPSIRSLLEEVRTQRQFQSELVSALRDCASAMESHRGKIPLCFPWEKFINPAKHLIARAEKEGRNR